MTKLTDTQTVILSAAAQRKNRSLLPVPPSIRAKGKALDRTFATLLKRGLAEEGKTHRDAEAWRRGDDERALGLYVTAVGLAAIGINEPPVEQDDALGRSERPRGKLEVVLCAVEAEAGATLDELVAATAWQPHTTRAAITRLRQRGFAIRLEERDGRKAYRLAA